MQDGYKDVNLPEAPSLVVRAMGLDDYSTVRHVHASAIRSLADRLIDPDEAAAAIKAIYSPSYVVDLSSKTMLVAVLNGSIVGTCAWSPNDDRGLNARIGALFVAPLFQGQSIGSQLVTHAERNASDHGFHSWTAIVPVSIVTMFQDLGYTVASYGTSLDVVPLTSLQVAFLRKPA